MLQNWIKTFKKVKHLSSIYYRAGWYLPNMQSAVILIITPFPYFFYQIDRKNVCKIHKILTLIQKEKEKMHDVINFLFIFKNVKRKFFLTLQFSPSRPVPRLASYRSFPRKVNKFPDFGQELFSKTPRIPACRVEQTVTRIACIRQLTPGGI